MWYGGIRNTLADLPTLFCTVVENRLQSTPTEVCPQVYTYRGSVGLRGFSCLGLSFPFKAIPKIGLSQR
jgi:hypothetical protein